MVKKLRDGEADTKQPLKKAKNFFWRVLQLVFGLLFVASIAVCVLFATGIIAIVEDEESGAVRLRYESPLTPTSEKIETGKTDSMTQNNESQSIENKEFEGDNIGWGPSIDKNCEKDNSTCDENIANLPSIANFDLDIDSLIYNASIKHPGESLTISDIRFTSNGRYVVAQMVSNRTQNNTVTVNDLYFYRSTYNSNAWTELKSLGNNQKLNCAELSSIQKLIIEDVYSERGCTNNNNY